MNQRHFVIGTTLAALVTAVVAVPAAAQATTWGGPATGGEPNANYAYPDVTILFARNGAHVELRNFQLLMECTARSDGYVSIVAFSAGGPSGYSATLRDKRLRMRFVSESGGRTASTDLRAFMRPNGKGSAVVKIEAVGRESDSGAIIEDCTADVSYKIQRFRAGRAPE